jgi:thiol-disulfide isomerase/thioredoxin
MGSFSPTLLLTAVLTAIPLAGAQIPRPSPEFVIALPNGQQELLSKYKGKVVVLEFLSTTCPHCQNSSKLLSKLNTELGPKGFQPIGAAINPEGDVADFVKRFGVNFPVGKTTRDTAYAYLQHSILAPTFYVPQMVFIDRNGVIRAQYGGSDAFLSTNEEANIRSMVEKLLAENAGSKSTAKPPAKAAKKG